jgi:WD repeat-containing protein 20
VDDLLSTSNLTVNKYGVFIFISVVGCAVYSMSLRQQLQDPGRKPMAALHYNKGDKDVSPNGRYA